MTAFTGNPLTPQTPPAVDFGDLTVVAWAPITWGGNLVETGGGPSRIKVWDGEAWLEVPGVKVEGF